MVEVGGVEHARLQPQQAGGIAVGLLDQRVHRKLNEGERLAGGGAGEGAQQIVGPAVQQAPAQPSGSARQGSSHSRARSSSHAGCRRPAG